MKRRRILIVAAVCALVGVGVAVLWPGSRKEPEYQGKKLSEWLYPNFSATGFEAATNAVRAVGTNALPWMLEGIAYEPTRFRRFLRRLPTDLYRLAAPEEVRRIEALRAFAILKGTAQPAVSQLTTWAADPTASERRRFARAALRHMGGGYLEVPARLEDLQSPDGRVRSSATNDLMLVAPDFFGNGAVHKQ
jgi:hypothetical protein